MLQTFRLVKENSSCSPFPPPLPRHSEALSVVRRGLDMVASYRPSVNMTWPGVDELMQDGLPWGECKMGGWEEGREGRRKGEEWRREEGRGRKKKEKGSLMQCVLVMFNCVRVWQCVLLPQIKLQQLQQQCNQTHALLSLLDDVDCFEDENDFHTPPKNEYHLQDSDQFQI